MKPSHLLVIFVLLLVFVACGTTPALRQVTMDGQDETGGVIDPINLWSSYQPRGRVTGQARHGETVGLVQQAGDGCEVRTAAGVEGWVTCSNFIKEFK